MDFGAVKRVLAAFEDEGGRYVVFGAARSTCSGWLAAEDLDVFVAPTAENLERLKAKDWCDAEALRGRSGLGERHRSLEEAQAQREAWEARDFEEFWRRQRAGGTRDPRRG